MTRNFKSTYDFSWTEDIYNEELDDFVNVQKNCTVEYEYYIEAGMDCIDDIFCIAGEQYPYDMENDIIEKIYEDLQIPYED